MLSARASEPVASLTIVIERVGDDADPARTVRTLSVGPDGGAVAVIMPLL